MSSPGSTEALTPNHFLKLNTKVVLPPPGVFKSADLYAGKWWRQVQHLTNEFCCRWKKEFPISLQERQKWTRTRKNLQVNDVVIIKDDDTPWNQWKVCHVVKALPDKDGLVSKVKLEVGSQYLPFNRKKKPDIVNSRKTNPQAGVTIVDTRWLKIKESPSRSHHGINTSRLSIDLSLTHELWISWALISNNLHV